MTAKKTATRAAKKAPPAKVVAPVPEEVQQELEKKAHLEVVGKEQNAVRERVQQYRAEVGVICTEMQHNRMRMDFLEKAAAAASGKLEEAVAAEEQLEHLYRHWHG